MTVAVKLCGIASREAAEAVKRERCAFAGFVFFPRSPRCVTPEQAAELAALLGAETKTVAVLVDPTDADIASVFSVFKPDYLQLHGSETPARAGELRARFGCAIIKAVKVQTGDDIAAAAVHAAEADYLLFDAKQPELPGMSMLPGGNGLAFDWPLLAKRRFDKPWFLSGGLSAENVEEAVRTSGAALVDASSSMEIHPGVKTPRLIHQFCEAARRAGAAA